MRRRGRVLWGAQLVPVLLGARGVQARPGQARPGARPGGRPGERIGAGGGRRARPRRGVHMKGGPAGACLCVLARCIPPWAGAAVLATVAVAFALIS